jgi:hypothetical protein
VSGYRLHRRQHLVLCRRYSGSTCCWQTESLHHRVHLRRLSRTILVICFTPLQPPPSSCTNATHPLSLTPSTSLWLSRSLLSPSHHHTHSHSHPFHITHSSPPRQLARRADRPQFLLIPCLAPSASTTRPRPHSPHLRPRSPPRPQPANAPAPSRRPQPARHRPTTTTLYSHTPRRTTRRCATPRAHTVLTRAFPVSSPSAHPRPRRRANDPTRRCALPSQSERLRLLQSQSRALPPPRDQSRAHRRPQRLARVQPPLPRLSRRPAEPLPLLTVSERARTLAPSPLRSRSRRPSPPSTHVPALRPHPRRPLLLAPVAPAFLRDHGRTLRRRQRRWKHSPTIPRLRCRPFL